MDLNSLEPESLVIRTLRSSDYPSFKKLEEEVWISRNMEVISLGTFSTWLKKHRRGFIGVFDTDQTLLGYAYCDRILFEENYIYYDRLPKVERYGYLGELHFPQGNAWYGISFAARTNRRGVGALLVKELFKRMDEDRIKQFVCTVRLPRMESYFKKMGISSPLLEQARAYAYQAVKTSFGRIHPILEQKITVELPYRVKKEPVVSLMQRFGCNLVDVVTVSGFSDPESCNYGAFLWVDHKHWIY